jgi:putative transposase
MRERPSHSHPAEGVLIFRDQPTIVFVTICSRKRRSQLANDSVHNALVESWSTAVAWLVGFYLIMPYHIHLFCTPNGEDHTLERWISFWKRRLRRQLRTPEALFQARSFHHRLRQDENYSEKWEYVRIPFARDRFLILINGLTKASLTNYLGGTDGGSAERRPTGDLRENNW